MVFQRSWGWFVVVIVQLLSHVRLFVTPWTASRQASPSFPVSQSVLKLMCIDSVMPSNQLLLCRPLILLPSIFPSIRVFSIDLALHIRWPKYWSFSFSVSPGLEHIFPAHFVLLLPSGRPLFAPCVCVYASIDTAVSEQTECENSGLFQDPGALIWAIILIMLFGLFWLWPEPQENQVVGP